MKDCKPISIVLSIGVIFLAIYAGCARSEPARNANIYKITCVYPNGENRFWYTEGWRFDGEFARFTNTDGLDCSIRWSTVMCFEQMPKIEVKPEIETIPEIKR